MNSIGVDAVVDLRQFPLGTPPYLRLLLLFEALELFNQINFKWYANGRTELKRYVLVGIRTTVFSFLYDNTYGISLFYPFGNAQHKAWQSCL